MSEMERAIGIGKGSCNKYFSTAVCHITKLWACYSENEGYIIPCYSIVWKTVNKIAAMTNKMMISENTVREILSSIQDPYLGVDFVSANAVHAITIENGVVSIKLRLSYPAKGYQETLIGTLKAAFAPVPGIDELNILVTWRVNSHVAQKGMKTMGNIKNIIAIASGKGGVGKSTVACNLALAIQAEGGTVGILDADIYGPSQPRMLGVSDKKPETREKRLQPIESYGLKSMSMGFLVEEEMPMVWRGPMVSSALQQLLNDTDWGDLDYLIVDLPPGTGDIQLTLAQKIPVSGVVIVTTPQDIALLDAKKALMMFRKVEVSVIGAIENMSVHICSQCGHEESIFGKEGVNQLKEQYGVPILGKIPLDIRVREQGDKGVPIVVAEPEGPLAMLYRELARRVTAELSLKPRDLTLPFSPIVVQNI